MGIVAYFVSRLSPPSLTFLDLPHGHVLGVIRIPFFYTSQRPNALTRSNLYNLSLQLKYHNAMSVPLYTLARNYKISTYSIT